MGCSFVSGVLALSSRGQVPSQHADPRKRANGRHSILRSFRRISSTRGIGEIAGEVMSLVGNLEDLSLGDIMQIISLSQKSGVLALKCEEGAGRIVFRAGLVHAACLEDRVEDLRGLLIASQTIDATTYDGFAAHAEKTGGSVVELLVSKSDLTVEQLDVLLRESVESSILDMFTWRSGDFSFDVRTQLDPADPQLVLSGGVNAQYLAMEGMRICDERSRDASRESMTSQAQESQPESPPDSDALFGDEPLEFDLDVSSLSTGSISDGSSSADILVATVLADESEAIELIPSVEDTGSVSSDPPPVPSSAISVPQRALVLIESDVAVLEWAKAAVKNDFSRVHVFQQAEQGLSRIRQYLIRGEFPVVMISTAVRIDAVSGINGMSDFVARLKSQAAKLLVLGLHEDDAVLPKPRDGVFDALIKRPEARHFKSQTGPPDAACAATFAAEVRVASDAEVDAIAPAPEPSQTPRAVANAETNVVRHLLDATAKLQEASSRGEVLPVVLDFASEVFKRVAILAVREEQVYAIAGRGIESLEVDPLDSSPPVSLQSIDQGWVREVLQSRGAVTGPPTTQADRDLLTRFGGVEPDCAYLGPIESGGLVIAMLYCDQGPQGADIPDTSGLEVVLQHAGLALDRAALERAFWEVDAETS